MEDLKLVTFTENDIEELTGIMKRAFDRDSQIHLDQPTGGPEGYDDGSFLRKWGLDKAATPYKILLNDRMIGGVILWINQKTKDNILGTIFIDDQLEEKGLGFRVWKMVESMYPDTKVWHTETPGFSQRNHHFYINKCGFNVIKVENPKDALERQFILEKKMK